MSLLAGVEPGLSLGPSSAVGFLFLGVVLVIAIGALSHAKERAFSASIIYLALGIAAGVTMRVTGFGTVLDPRGNPDALEYLTSGALAIALFSAGLRIRRPLRLRTWSSPLRLLLVAMPLTILAVAAWGRLAMGVGLGAAIALGAALAPTDPVLAGDLGVRPPLEEDEDASEPEFALSVEAGANDGLALPFLVLGLVVAGEEHGYARWVGLDLVYPLVVSVLLGGLLGYGLGWALLRLRAAELVDQELDRWLGIGAALALFGAAEAVGGYGLIAVFAGGIGFRRHESDHSLNRDVHDGGEVLKNFGELAVILVLGTMLGLASPNAPGLWGWLLVPLLLLVIRPLSVALSLLPTSMRPREVAWIGWFGVKGVASINYLAIALVSKAFLREDNATLSWTILFTVAVSILVHGVTSHPLTERLLGAEE